MAKGKKINFVEFPKPKNDGNGANIQFNYSPENQAIFMTMAKQIAGTTVKDARFDYNHKIIIKLSVLDICEFINVFRGKVDKIKNPNGEGILHRSVKDGEEITTSVHLNKNDPKYGGYYIKAQKNIKEKDFFVSYATRISENEAYILTILFNEAIVKMHNWGEEKSFYKEGK